MALFGWGSSKGQTKPELDAAVGDTFDPAALFHGLEQIVPRYLDGVDKHELIYPACTRTPGDAHGSVVVRPAVAHDIVIAIHFDSVVALPR